MKLFACDLDGTLLNEKHQTDTIIDQGIEEVMCSGNVITIASGRTYCQITPIGLPENMYCICMNGALILDHHQNIVYKDLIDKTLLSDILDTFSDEVLEYTTKDGQYCLQDKDTYLKTHNFNYIGDDETLKKVRVQFLKHVHFSCTKEEILKMDIGKINVHKVKGKNIEKLDSYLLTHSDQLVNAATFDGLYEITSKSVNKGESIHILAQYLGVDDDEVYVYGDAGNDLEMLKRFKHAYVPENGTDQAKAHALEIIGHNKDHSVIHHILDQIKK